MQKTKKAPTAVLFLSPSRSPRRLVGPDQIIKVLIAQRRITQEFGKVPKTREKENGVPRGKHTEAHQRDSLSFALTRG